MNEEVALWILVFLQTISIFIRLCYYIISIMLRWQAQKQSEQTDALIKEHLKDESL